MQDFRLALSDRPGSPESTINDELMILETPDGPKKVLEEQEYLDRVTKIIRRDFFPDLHFSTDNSVTPRTDSNIRDTPGTQISTTSSLRSRREATSLSLNEYFERYTSEDDAYFERLQRREKKRHQRRYPWLYKDVILHNKDVKNQLKLPSNECDSSTKEHCMEKKMIDWQYNPKNSLFYPPRDKSSKSQSVINYNSSRLVYDADFKRPLPPSDYNPSGGYDNFTANSKIRIDGKLTESIPDKTPVINGFSFVPEPERPTLSMSGLLNPDGEDKIDIKSATNPRGKYFTLCQSPRDELAHKLYEDRVGKFIRTPRNLKHGKSSRTSTPGSLIRSVGTPSTGYRRDFSDFDITPNRVRTPSSKLSSNKKS